MYLDNRIATLRTLAEILEKCDGAVTWLITNEKVVAILEYMLWDCLKVGVSFHLSGTSPCMMFDLERLMTLTKNSLGKEHSEKSSFYRLQIMEFIGACHYDNLYKMAKVGSNDVDVTLFNDGNEHFENYRREHLIHLEMTGIFGCSENMFTAEMRQWNGSGDICFKSKSKRRLTYAGRDVGETLFSKKVVDDDTLWFKGSHSLPTERPPADVKLYPINAEMRTIIG